ncbi:hypothetical protein HMPREF1981_02093 [Bacteroides pyogenes F0041]|uniref:Uncharacterized protein n=1 Tax=Bacteroides pyogenes F0041 TaxID=1321819 RepID=U2CKE3_9BACE|nr:hypothetical protein HMPREF1981_02093 [Bacteroides pyogenes F0041]
MILLYTCSFMKKKTACSHDNRESSALLQYVFLSFCDYIMNDEPRSFERFSACTFCSSISCKHLLRKFCGVSSRKICF